MPKASELATELRKFADSLDTNPDAEIVKAYLGFSCYAKEAFLATVRLLPRPLKKKVNEYANSRPDLQMSYESPALYAYTTVPQSLTCTLVEPARKAVYKCDPILSETEDAELEVA